MNKINWTKKRLTDLGKFARGKSKHRPRNDKTLFKNGHYPLVQTGDIKKANLYIQKSEEFYNEKGLKQSKLWPTDTLCITIAANIAETALLGQPMCFPDSIVGFNAFPNESNNLFVHYVFELLKQQIQDNINGSIQKNINLDFLENFELMVPPLNYQNKVSKLLKDIDFKIANNNAISKELESIAKTIYDYWFLQFEFPDKDGKPYKSNGGKMVWNDQLKQEIPEGWEVRKLKDIIVENPKSKIKVKEAQQDHFGDIPFFTSGQSILSMDEKLVTGMNCYLNTGGNADVKYFYGPASYSTDTWSIKGKVFMEYLLPFILKNLQRSMDDKFFQGTGLRHLQKPLLKDYPILVPNEEIISKFIPLVSDVFKKVSDSYRENIELEKMRNFLLPMLMNGQVTIKD